MDRVAPESDTEFPIEAGVAQDSVSSPLVGEFPLSAQPKWMLRYRLTLVSLDFICVVSAIAVAYLLRSQTYATSGPWSRYGFCSAAIVMGWILALQYCGGYEVRHLASGPEEAKRVFRASALTLSVLAIACYILKTQVARGFVLEAIPLGAILLLAERSVVRHCVARQRTGKGTWLHRIVAVGTAESVLALIESTERAKSAGLKIIGVCIEDGPVGAEVAPNVRVLGGVLEAASCAERVHADVIAVTGSGLGPVGIRELGWQLEGTGRGMVMAPALTEIAGTRMHISPVEGLPLMWLEQPRLGRIPQLLKRAFDLAAGSVLLLLMSPLFLGTAVAIKCTSRGPIFFRQSRLGFNGEKFSIIKFRSMYDGSADLRADLLTLNDQDGGGVLFKIRRDPRITPVGRWIRKFSVDELPQLIHVVTGQMSLVGPRPLAVDDSTYQGFARRRLLVRPGITGLWQVSGRSDLSWDDAVRLDLYYVENWSMELDLSILGRTVFAVLGRRGAY